jgi:hypothetical protein
MTAHLPQPEDFLGIIQKAAERVVSDIEYPKFVKPHPSHVVTQGDHVSTPAFPEFHVDRMTREVTVLVHSVDEEQIAILEFVKPDRHESADVGV